MFCADPVPNVCKNMYTEKYTLMSKKIIFSQLILFVFVKEINISQCVYVRLCCLPRMPGITLRTLSRMLTVREAAVAGAFGHLLNTF